MKPSGHIAPVRRRIADLPDISVRMTYYPPGNRMDVHAHDRDQFSLLILGSFQESTGADDCDLFGHHIGYKPAGYRHENRYGPDGTLILAVETPPGRIADGRGRWRQTEASGNTMTVLQVLLQTREEPEKEDIVAELLTFISDPAGDEGLSRMAASRPAWLLRVRDALHDAPDEARLEALSRSEGIHHAHLSRAFARSYGLPLSVYRRRLMAMRAARSMLSQRKSAAEAAQLAGFADQAHMTRVMRRETGLTPGRLQQLFA